MPLLMLKDLPRYECILDVARRFPDLDPSACEAYLNILRAADEVYRQSEGFFSAHSLSPGRFTVLMLLYDKVAGEPVPLTPAELADKAGVTRATMTGLVDTLERDGLVRREHNSGDRRMMLVHLTEKARESIEGILPIHYKRIAALMSPLSEHERKTLVRLLNKVAAKAAAMSVEANEAAHAHSA
jgi:DNA-binding MarR family transcriptional regulator